MRRLVRLAVTRPDRAATIFASISSGEQTVSRDTLERWTNQIARLMADRDVTSRSMLVTGVWNSPELIAFTIAAWKLSARVLPLRAILPSQE